MDRPTPRLAGTGDAAEVAVLLHAFNEEFDTDTPGPAVLERRLATLLTQPTTFAVVAGAPSLAVALVTLRTNVWYDGPVALLDELYVVPAERNRGIGSAVMAVVIAEARSRGVRLVEVNVDEGDVDAHRFYARHHFDGSGSSPDERSFMRYRDLTQPAARPLRSAPGP